MRSNLALADSFMRMSFLDASTNKDLPDLGFLEVERGEEQRTVHNHAIITLITALLYQAVQNYCDMKRFKPELEDPGVENFLNGLKGRGQFIEGMRVIRHHTFHIDRLNRKERQSVAAFGEACEQHGGAYTVMRHLLDVLYEYTEKCFMGDLRVFPDQQYEDLEMRKREDPHFAERWEKGELTRTDLLGSDAE